MTTENEFDLEALFQAEDERLAPEPFTRSVMTRIAYASMIRRIVLGVGILVGAVAALLILPSGLMDAMGQLGQFEVPKLTLQTLPGLLSSPYSMAGVGVLAGLATLAATWGLEKAG